MAKQYGKSKIIKGATYELKDELVTLPQVVIIREVKINEENEVVVGVSFIDDTAVRRFRPHVDRWVSPCNLRAHNIW
jgi:hypothetical protein